MAFAKSSPLGFIDPLGLDFIAVAGRPVGGLFWLSHYSVQYWATCAPAPTKEIFVEEWLKQLETSPYAAKKRASVELLQSKFKVKMRNTGEIADVYVSYIHRGDGGKTFVSVFSGTRSQVRAKWIEIMVEAESYRYAEHPGESPSRPEEVDGPFENWPQSKYGMTNVDYPFNNSNTFVRHIIGIVGLKMIELKGKYPGNTSPVEVPDLYDGVPFR